MEDKPDILVLKQHFRQLSTMIDSVVDSKRQTAGELFLSLIDALRMPRNLSNAASVCFLSRSLVLDYIGRDDYKFQPNPSQVVKLLGESIVFLEETRDLLTKDSEGYDSVIHFLENLNIRLKSFNIATDNSSLESKYQRLSAHAEAHMVSSI